MTKQQIGRLIRKTRQQQQKTAYRICKEAGIATHQLRNIEQALTNYTVESLQAVCKVLDLELIVELAL